MRVLNLFSHGFSLPSGFFLEKPLCRQVSSIIEHNIVAQNCPKSSPVSSSVKTVKSPEKQSGLVPSQQPQVWQTTPQLKAPRAGRLVMSCVESNLPFECDSSCSVGGARRVDWRGSNMEPCKDPHTTIIYRVLFYTRSPSLYPFVGLQSPPDLPTAARDEETLGQPSDLASPQAGHSCQKLGGINGENYG